MLFLGETSNSSFLFYESKQIPLEFSRKGEFSFKKPFKNLL